jgi:hypothetical protein
MTLIRANTAQLRQVLLNLITNASEALRGDAGVITVRLSEVGLREAPWTAETKPPRGRYLRLEVSDTGSGMTEQIRARIFDPFFTTKGSGRGLGLAAVQGIVHSHGGQISVNTTPGRGTRFEVFLPSASTAVEQVAVGREALKNPPKLEGTVLMVEDQEVLRTSVAKMLRTKGLRVLEAGNGIEARALPELRGRDRHYGAGREFARFTEPRSVEKVTRNRGSCKDHLNVSIWTRPGVVNSRWRTSSPLFTQAVSHS